MLRFALPQLNSLQEIQQYVRQYPLPAMPELQVLRNMSDMVATIDPEFVDEIFHTVEHEFRERLNAELDLNYLSEEMIDELRTVLYEQAVRDVAYIAPGLLKQTRGEHTLLKRAVNTLVSQASLPSEDAVEAAWDLLNQYFDEIEHNGNIAISFEQRQEFLNFLLDETEDYFPDLMEGANDEMYSALQAAESTAQETLQEELDNFAAEIADEVQLDEDPVGHSRNNRLPFYNWEEMVEWYDQLLGDMMAEKSNPEFKTKSRPKGQRVVDVTHLQEDAQHALRHQRRP